MKATQGLRFVDPRFKLNWAATEKAGIIRGAYHFLEADQDGAAQAKHFMKTVDFTKGDLIPVVDVERKGKDLAQDTQGVSCRGEGHPRGRCRHLRVTVVLERTPCECIRDRSSQSTLGRGVRRDHAEGRPEHGPLARLAVHQIGKGRWRFRPGGPESSEDDHWHLTAFGEPWAGNTPVSWPETPATGRSRSDFRVVCCCRGGLGQFTSEGARHKDFGWSACRREEI